MIYWVDSEDDWRCDCGNHTMDSGFDTCLPDGTPIEPLIDSSWVDHYFCVGCADVVAGSEVRQRVIA